MVLKPFSSVVTRNVVFIKIANTFFQEETGELQQYLFLKDVSSDLSGRAELTVYSMQWRSFLINSPNDYYLVRNWNFWWRWHSIPVVEAWWRSYLRVELNSAYADTDFVTLLL